MNISLLQLPKRKQRAVLVKRMCQSEKDYNSKVLLLQDMYLRTLQQDRTILATPEWNRMFCNIDDLIAVSTCLLIRLNDEISRCEEEGTDLADVPMGSVFLTLVKPHLEAFANYCLTFSQDVERTFFCLNQREKFRNFLTEREAKVTPLMTLLRLPLGRVGKYHYMFRQLIRCTEEDDPDIKSMQTFIQMCADHTQAIHEKILVKTNEQRLKEVSDRISGLNFSLVNPTRRYIYEGPLMKHYSRGLHYRYFFLFSDLIVYCTGADCARGEGLEFKDRIFLNSDPMPYTDPIEDDELRQRYNGFHIFTGKAAVTLFADSPEEKSYWMNLIEEALHALKIDSNERSLQAMNVQMRSNSFTDEKKKSTKEGQAVRGTSSQSLTAEGFLQLETMKSPSSSSPRRLPPGVMTPPLQMGVPILSPVPQPPKVEGNERNRHGINVPMRTNSFTDGRKKFAKEGQAVHGTSQSLNDQDFLQLEAFKSQSSSSPQRPPPGIMTLPPQVGLTVLSPVPQVVTTSVLSDDQPCSAVPSDPADPNIYRTAAQRSLSEVFDLNDPATQFPGVSVTQPEMTTIDTSLGSPVPHTVQSLGSPTSSPTQRVLSTIDEPFGPSQVEGAPPANSSPRMSPTNTNLADVFPTSFL